MKPYAKHNSFVKFMAWLILILVIIATFVAAFAILVLPELAAMVAIGTVSLAVGLIIGFCV